MIKLENISYKYKKGKIVVNNVNETIEEGKFICIIGKNGSRKIYYC